MINRNGSVSQYDMGYINKNYILMERPFPISDIYITADYNGTGILHLVLRTPLSQSITSHAVDGIQWGPKSHIWNHDDSLRWYFDLNLHKKSEIKTLFKNVLSRLIGLTSSIRTQARIHLIQEQIGVMLDMYFMNYPYHRLPPNDFITSDKREKDFLDNSTDAKDLYLAVRKIDIEEVHHILCKGTNPNSFFYGFTALNGALNIESLTHARKETRSQSKMLDIISLLLEYGADPMLESSFGYTAFEDTIKYSLYAKHTPAEYYEQAIRRLTAAPSFHPHMHTDIQGGSPNIGRVIHGANLFYKELAVNNQQTSHQISNMFYQESSLVFCMSDGQSLDQITVNVMSAEDFKDEEKNKDARNKLYELTKNNFPWQTSFENEEKFKKYFYPFLTHPANMIETVYLNNHLVGIIFSEKLWINNNAQEYIIHFNKLTVADKIFREKFKGFMTNLAYARVFALQVMHPNIPVLYYFEAASIASYLGAKDIAYPKIQTDEMDALMNQIAEKLYGTNKTKHNNVLFANDDLASATTFKSPSSSSFWNKRDVEVKIYNDRYQRNKQSLLMGFFSNGNNLTKIHKQIKKNVGGDRFFDMIQLYAQNDTQNIHVIPDSKL